MSAVAKRDVLHARAEEIGDKAADERAVALRAVEHEPQADRRSLSTTWLCTTPPGSMTSCIGVFLRSKSEV